MGHRVWIINVLMKDSLVLKHISINSRLSNAVKYSSFFKKSPSLLSTKEISPMYKHVWKMLAMHKWELYSIMWLSHCKVCHDNTELQHKTFWDHLVLKLVNCSEKAIIQCYGAGMLPWSHHGQTKFSFTAHVTVQAYVVYSKPAVTVRLGPGGCRPDKLSMCRRASAICICVSNCKPGILLTNRLALRWVIIPIYLFTIFSGFNTVRKIQPEEVR